MENEAANTVLAAKGRLRCDHLVLVSCKFLDLFSLTSFQPVYHMEEKEEMVTILQECHLQDYGSFGEEDIEHTHLLLKPRRLVANAYVCTALR